MHLIGGAKKHLTIGRVFVILGSPEELLHGLSERNIWLKYCNGGSFS